MYIYTVYIMYIDSIQFLRRKERLALLLNAIFISGTILSIYFIHFLENHIILIGNALWKSLNDLMGISRETC